MRAKSAASFNGIAEKAAVRRLKAFELRLQGLAYREIGAQIGVTDERARQYVAEELKHLATKTHEKAEDLRQLELARLERLTKRWQRVAEGKSKEAGRATEILLRIAQRRADLLGLDGPQKVDHTSGGKTVKFVVKVGPGRISSEKVTEAEKESNL